MSVKILPTHFKPWKLLRGGRALVGVMPLASMMGLCRDLCDTAGEAEVRVILKNAGHELGRLEGMVSATLMVNCQRCLQPMDVVVQQTPIHLYLTKSESREGVVPDGEESWVCGTDDAISLVEWLEQELLLCLPIVAKHPESECGLKTSPSASGDEAFKNPFRGLKDHF